LIIELKFLIYCSILEEKEKRTIFEEVEEEGGEQGRN